jgi:prophage tail gpP-like protein
MDRIRIETEHPTDPTETPFVLEDWISYDITSDMMSGADTFTIDAVPHADNLFGYRVPGHVIRVYYDDALIFTGIVEATPTSANESGLTLQLTGRDYGGLLVDDAAPLLDLRDKTLFEIVEKLIEPHSGYITQIDVDYSLGRYRVSGKSGKAKRPSPGYASIKTDKMFQNTIRAGEKIGAILDMLCDHIGCRWWLGSDGTLYVARPQYQQEAIAKLFVKIDDHGNITDSNCSINRSSDIGDRHATYAVVGQGRGGATQSGVDVADKFGEALDPSKSLWYDLNTPRFHKTETTPVKSLSNRKLAKRLARTIAEEKIVRTYSMTATVEGHWTSVVNPRDDGDRGTLWGVDMVVDVEYQPKRIAAPHYILGRNFRGDKDGGRETNLTLIPSDIWLATEHDVVPTATWATKLRNTMDYYAL